MDNHDQAPSIKVAPPGPQSHEWYTRLTNVESPAFVEQRNQTASVGESHDSIVYDSGLGSNVWDVDGNRYVDLVAGFGSLAFGHLPKIITTAVDQQSELLGLALGDVYSSPIKIELCERLSNIYPEVGARVMLSLSGGDAITTALKTAILATGRPGVLAFYGSYHGLSYGPLAACGFSDALKEPFSQQLGIPVSFITYPTPDSELESYRKMVSTQLKTQKIGAVLFEPIQGRGGCVVPPFGLTQMLREECDKFGVLLIADEIWTGFGRTGTTLMSLADGAIPDLICVGKALGSGWPISACIGRASVMSAWGKHGGTAIHTGTHFGNPLACAAANATLIALDKLQLPARALRIGSIWKQALCQLVQNDDAISVLGVGLMIGISFEKDPTRALTIKKEMLRRGYITLTAGPANQVLMLTPALTIDEKLLHGFVDELGAILTSKA